MKSANESAVLETISPQQKRKTTVIHAKNSEKVPVTTNAKEGAVLVAFYPSRKKETTTIHAKNSDKVRAQTKMQFKRPFHPSKKRKTTVIHPKNSEKVPVMTSAKEGAVFESILPQQKKGDDDNTRLEYGEGTSANESAV